MSLTSRLTAAVLTGLPLLLAASNAHALTPTLPTGTTNMTVTGTVDVGNCAITVGYATMAVQGPAQYLVFARREPSGTATCAGAHGYEVLAPGLFPDSAQNGTTSPIDVVIAKGESNQIAVVYDFRISVSPSAPVYTTALRLAPATLATLATTGGILPPGQGTPSMVVHSAKFTVAGDLLFFGTKNGTFPASIELTTAGGTNYQARLPGFAAATGTAAGVEEVLSW